ncbi:hypothetical protein AXG93_2145s1820 [Marchantia polymorpha subsp. ruderalis]|uniref:Uncharacterized protein n=1 Tax=Marchantia polymorpha subsp. ruderalis TaxID=1480154 RepID=A0A176W088_MARPO|nr:hypothetical protein AXG93_2145s1820 [Marchantia polymorpha subsp. ruderalis]
MSVDSLEDFLTAGGMMCFVIMRLDFDECGSSMIRARIKLWSSIILAMNSRFSTAAGFMHRSEVEAFAESPCGLLITSDGAFVSILAAARTAQVQSYFATIPFGCDASNLNKKRSSLDLCHAYGLDPHGKAEDLRRCRFDWNQDSTLSYSRQFSEKQQQQQQQLVLLQLTGSTMLGNGVGTYDL